MKKYLITILFALIIGFFLGNFLLSQYSENKKITVSSNGEEMYFIQYGMYSSLKEMEENTINLENYIYSFLDNKYYVYIGITKDSSNIEKMQQYYKDLGYETNIKTYHINNSKFSEVITNYDLIINKIDDKVTLGSVICQVLEKYEEVANGSKN